VLERRPAGAFDYANRDAERSTSFRSNTKNESNRFTHGYCLEAHTRFPAISMAYLNRTARAVRHYTLIIIE